MSGLSQFISLTCPHCNAPFKRQQSLVSHERYCPKKHISSRQPTYAMSRESLTVEHQPDVQQDVEFDNTHDNFAPRQDAPQDHALGYDNTMLLNVSSLSNMARATLDRRYSRIKPILEHDDSVWLIR